MKLKFQSHKEDPFYVKLKQKVEPILSNEEVLDKAKWLLWFKLIFYSTLFGLIVLALFIFQYQSIYQLIVHYCLIGLSGMLLAYNSSHDAVHGTFTTNKKINNFIYQVTFNLQGTNAYLWGIRHISSHHIFANVDGCDADIDDNPFIRLSPAHPYKRRHRFQHIYCILIYSIYTLHWILIKDILYLRKKQLANLRNIYHPLSKVLNVIGWKIMYFTYILILPLMLTAYPFSWILSAFFIMHVVISLFFIFTLIFTHLCLETDFPIADTNGNLPYNYYQHQLAVSVDYYPTSHFANFLFGGFNAHAAHHLFPKQPHTLYPLLSTVIQETAQEFGYRYNKVSMIRGIISHFLYLKRLGRQFDC